MTGTVLSRLIGPFSVPCLLLGLVFFAASLTPSLIPRGPEMQGVLGGLVTALAYLAGQIVALVWRAADLPEPSGRSARVATWIASFIVGILFLWILGSSLTWQNDLRQKMGMAPADGLNLARIVLIAIVVFAASFLLGRAVASFFRLVRGWFYRVMPPRRANVLGFVTVVLLLVIVTRDGILDRVVRVLDES